VGAHRRQGAAGLEHEHHDWSDRARADRRRRSCPPHHQFGCGKATNLNADLLDGRDSTYFLPTTGKAADANKLDGIDSTGFVRGRGTLLSNRIVFVPTNTKTLLTIPGLGYLQAYCPTGGAGAYVVWGNNSGGPVDVWQVGPAASKYRAHSGRAHETGHSSGPPFAATSALTAWT